MVLSKIQMFGMIGVSNPQSRNAIIADFLSEGIEGLRRMTVEDVREACAGYAKRTDNPFPVILTPIQKQRFKSLVLWVKDMDRVSSLTTNTVLVWCCKDNGVVLVDCRNIHTVHQTQLACPEGQRHWTQHPDLELRSKSKQAWF